MVPGFGTGLEAHPEERTPGFRVQTPIKRKHRAKIPDHEVIDVDKIEDDNSQIILASKISLNTTVSSGGRKRFGPSNSDVWTEKVASLECVCTPGPH
ncbi:hypothetical protein PGT21_002762 [Puccinia graminis f. sp. tritici]|uniref:Uncharacterized protein n=1 Tax=Puccinia graminis f. sp. tritici TaxID=56615 RepID=A0A5B0M134_PUCGR|nr:hypothetical protein PGTUg99_006848 [Puccinia graminis f. sp. tritici]KAA1071301.1 hypothetical protein PGT21_002762 [Puccinia graminis f. sp. tritici]